MISRSARALGTVIGSAVGDALGAPFEFGPEGAFSARFPEPGTGVEMCGGGGWDPGEATDDTQPAVLVDESLLECGGPELPDVFTRFRTTRRAWRPTSVPLPLPVVQIRLPVVQIRQHGQHPAMAAVARRQAQFQEDVADVLVDRAV